MSREDLAQVLSRLTRHAHPDLLVGYSGVDDAAVYRIAGDRALVMTTDFFPPVIDDPRTFGMVAAANALSDVYAMGGTPLVALNLVGFPKTLSMDVLAEILEGGSAKIHEAGACVGGGHSVADTEVKYGLAVTGMVDPNSMWVNGTVRPGHVLILTKPIGSGLVTSAIKVDADEGPVVQEAIRWMTTLNGAGIEHLRAATPSGVTDVTGYGLLGHALELVEGSAAALNIRAAAVPRLKGIEDYFQKRYRTRGARETREATRTEIALDERLDPWAVELLFDPQTSGGLLCAVPEEAASNLVARLIDAGLEAATVIGEAIPYAGGPRITVSP